MAEAKGIKGVMDFQPIFRKTESVILTKGISEISYSK